MSRPPRSRALDRLGRQARRLQYQAAEKTAYKLAMRHKDAIQRGDYIMSPSRRYRGYIRRAMAYQKVGKGIYRVGLDDRLTPLSKVMTEAGIRRAGRMPIFVPLSSSPIRVRLSSADKRTLLAGGGVKRSRMVIFANRERTLLFARKGKRNPKPIPIMAIKQTTTYRRRDRYHWLRRTGKAILKDKIQDDVVRDLLRRRFLPNK